MKTYAPSGVCLDCGQNLTGDSYCSRCGLPAVGLEVEQVRLLLRKADAVMARLDIQRLRQPVSVGQPVSGPVTAPPASPPPFPPSMPPHLPPSFPVPPGPTRPPRRTLSAGSVLLALGAGCLVVAAVVFVAVTWGSLSLASRTLLLLAVTALAFAVTARLTTRRLHGSVEALSAVAWTFLAIDLLAGRSAGLFGLNTLDGDTFVAVSGMCAAVPASLAAWATRRLVDREPLVTSIVALGGWLMVMVGLGADAPVRAAWLLVWLILLAGALAIVYRLLNLTVLASALASLALLLHAALLLVAAVSCLAHDHRDLVETGDLWPVLAAMVMTVLAAEGLRREERTQAWAGAILGVAAVCVTGLLCLLVVAPAWQSGIEEGTVALCVVAVALAGLGRTSAVSWTSGARVLTPLVLLACVGVALPWLSSTLALIAELPLEPWGYRAGRRVRIADPFEQPLWTAVLCLLTVAACILLLSAWEGLGLSRRAAISAAGAIVWVTGVLVATDATSLLWVAIVTVAVPGLVLMAAGTVADRRPAAVAGGAALAAASGVAMASVVLSLVVWSAVLVVCVAAMAWRPRSTSAAWQAVAAVLLAAGVTAAVVDVTGGAATDMAVPLALLLALIAAATAIVPAVPPRLGAMVGAVAAAPAPVLLAVMAGPGRLALVLTLLGGAAALVGVLDRTRRPLAVAGTVLLVVAWWARLTASEIEVVEAYTGLPAAILLTAGLWAVLAHRTPTLQALLPGLALALTPSLPWAVLDPTSTRGWLVFAAGLVLLSAGTALRWLAPFLAGASVVALMTVVHLTPVADAVPRWALLASAGLVLLGVGITWEARVRDLRSMAVFVTAMR